MVLIKLTDFRRGEFYLNADYILNFCDVLPEHLERVTKEKIVHEPRTTIFIGDSGPGASMLVAETKEEVVAQIQSIQYGFFPQMSATQFGDGNMAFFGSQDDNPNT